MGFVVTTASEYKIADPLTSGERLGRENELTNTPFSQTEGR